MIRLIGAGLIHLGVVYALGRVMGYDGAALAIAPVVGAALISGGAGLGSALINKFGGGGQTFQMPMEPKEITDARKRLLGFAETGQFGDFKAGAEVPLNYGDYGATGLETQGLSKLQELLSSGIPAQYQMGVDALKPFLSTNPLDVSAQFDPFRAQVMRQIGESEDALKRTAGFTGNLYGTKTIEGLGDIRARGNETLTAELARLTDNALNRRLQAIPLAFQSAESGQQMDLGKIAASQQYGGLIRQLNDASIKARDAELLRRRQELQLPIQAAQSILGSAPQYGVPSVQNPSPYQGLLNTIGGVAGQFMGNQMFLEQQKRMFPGVQPPSPMQNLNNSIPDWGARVPSPSSGPVYTPGWGMPPYK